MDGTWLLEQVQEDASSMRIALDEQDVVHAIWQVGFCGDETCDVMGVRYSSRRDGAWQPPTRATSTSFEATIAVGRDTGIIIGVGCGGANDGLPNPACLVSSSDGVTFSETCELPPPGGASRTALSHGGAPVVALSADTGLPIALYGFFTDFAYEDEQGNPPDDLALAHFEPE